MGEVRTSAGVLLWRTIPQPEVFLAHMGGPYWVEKDVGAWSIPKGELEPGEDPEAAARREFREELGLDVPPAAVLSLLGTYTYTSGKEVTVFTGDGGGFDPSDFTFGTFKLEWPQNSGTFRDFPEVDRAEWMSFDKAAERLVKGQRPALVDLAKQHGVDPPIPGDLA